jgi:arylformamidase
MKQERAMPPTTQSPHSALSRRALVAGAGIASVVGASKSAFAQQPAPRAKGPPVWLGMDQKELDDAYDQSKYAPNIQIVLKRCARNSELVRAPRRSEALRLRSDAGRGAGCIHPQERQRARPRVRAWRRLALRARQGLPLRGRDVRQRRREFRRARLTNVRETGGDLMPMADQIRRGVAWVYKNAKSFGGDPERLYISGHSSGGHWAGVLLTTDWQKDFGLPATLIKGGRRGQRNVRYQTGQALGAFELRQVHR